MPSTSSVSGASVSGLLPLRPTFPSGAVWTLTQGREEIHSSFYQQPRPHSAVFVQQQRPGKQQQIPSIESIDHSFYRQPRHLFSTSYIPDKHQMPLWYRADPLPDYWQEFANYTQTPVAPWFVPPKPPPRAPWQRSWELPDFYWEQFEQFRRHPLPSMFTQMQAGVSGVYVPVTGAGQAGSFRAQNDIKGYNIYLGAGTLPDLTQPPAAFGHTLPITLTLTPPVSGTLTYYVLVRAQDHYGLESQNQYYQTITIRSDGTLDLGILSPPLTLALFPQGGGRIRVLATYPGLLTDTYPADTWRVWYNLNSPPDTAQPPNLTQTVTVQALQTTLGPLAAGLYYVSVAVYRTPDAKQSAVITSSTTLPDALGEVVPVPSGFQGT